MSSLRLFFRDACQKRTIATIGNSHISSNF